MQIRRLDQLTSLLTDEHLRQRIDPRHGDVFYLHLSDLLLGIKMHATDTHLDVLDFGAGISPYRSLFPNANYQRADFAIGDGEALDYVLNESLVVDAPDNKFDLILSTQVLEHVKAPGHYLKECLRLLRPGGKLVLSTHGIFEDHPCPLDLHRWTADGLELLCTESGFNVVAVNKLTTNARALFFLYDHFGRSTHRRAFSLYSALLSAQFRIYRRFRKSFHKWADDFFPASRVTTNENRNKYRLYICLLVHATKPL
jgi:SAM-dependent methyltransferase